MTPAWPAVCTAAALGLLLVLIIRFKVQAFVALIVVSLGLGLAAGLPPGRVMKSIGTGIGEIMAGVAVILALGSMLGRILDASGAAEVIARTLLEAFGERRASLAILAAAYLIGIPVLFGVGFLILIPILWRLQRDTGKSLLWFTLPLTFSLGTTHSLVPPHPGIVGVVQQFGGASAGTVMIQTIVFGTLMGIPIVLVGWLGPGRWWASRQMVEVPEHLAGKDVAKGASGEKPAELPSFVLAVFIVTMPLLLSLLGFGATLLKDLHRLPDWVTLPVIAPEAVPSWLAFLTHPLLEWLNLLGHPTMALLVPTGLAFLLLGARRGIGRERLGKLATSALLDVGEILFLFGAAGAFKQVIQDTGAGTYIAAQIRQLPLSTVAVAYLIAALMRVALGSATAAILTAAAVLADLVKTLPGQETLMVLAVANGATFMTQPADSGFWMVKEYCNLSARDVLVRFNACRITMSLTGLALLLAYEAWWK